MQTNRSPTSLVSIVFGGCRQIFGAADIAQCRIGSLAGSGTKTQKILDAAQDPATGTVRMAGERKIPTGSLLSPVTGHRRTLLLRPGHIRGDGGPGPTLRRIAQSVNRTREFDRCLAQQGGNPLFLEQWIGDGRRIHRYKIEKLAGVKLTHSSSF